MIIIETNVYNFVEFFSILYLIDFICKYWKPMLENFETKIKLIFVAAQSFLFTSSFWTTPFQCIPSFRIYKMINKIKKFSWNFILKIFFTYLMHLMRWILGKAIQLTELSPRTLANNLFCFTWLCQNTTVVKFRKQLFFVIFSF